MRTPEQISKQASANSNACRVKWQRQAIANGAKIAELNARVGDLATQLVASLDKRVIDRTEIENLRRACRQAENEADIWRSKAHELEDMDVQRKAREMAKGA
jgi:hypothetical protein